MSIVDTSLLPPRPKKGDADYDEKMRVYRAAYNRANSRAYYQANKERIATRNRAKRGGPPRAKVVDVSLLPPRPKNGDPAYDEKMRVRKRAHHKAYSITKQGKATIDAYRKSDKGRESQRRGVAKHQKTDKGKRSRIRYATSGKGKATIDAYRKSDKGRESQRRAHKKYRKTTKGKAVMAAYEITDTIKAIRRDFRFKKLGMTRAQVEEMIENQNGLCAICRNPPTGNGIYKKLHLDHCHKTSTVREMLCRLCNQLLGLMDDAPARLRTAADYLEKHDAGT